MTELTGTDLTNVLLLILIGLQGLGALGLGAVLFMAKRTQAVSKMTELNTNSMKDALVAATRAASYAAGREAARVVAERLATEVEKDRSKT